jgi:hypothetical protein
MHWAPPTHPDTHPPSMSSPPPPPHPTPTPHTRNSQTILLPLLAADPLAPPCCTPRVNTPNTAICHCQHPTPLPQGVSADLPSPAELEGRQYQSGEALSEAAAAAGGDASPSGVHEDEFDWEQVSTWRFEQGTRGLGYYARDWGTGVLGPGLVEGWRKGTLANVVKLERALFPIL